MTQSQAPDTVAGFELRQRPQIQVAPPEPPSRPAWVNFHHPANNLIFLKLPALDYCSPNFGLHYGTAVTACQILACNEEGFLSSSRDHGDICGRINVDPDSIILPGDYYYHLLSPKSEALYPLCRDFSRWTFPHGHLPPVWTSELVGRTTDKLDIWPEDWTELNVKIKARDHWQCLISGSKDSLSASYIVGKKDETWVRQIRP